MMHMLDNDIEYRARIMELNKPEKGEYETAIQFNLTAGISQYRVRYFANDSLGNEILTEEYTYELYPSLYASADGSAYLFDTPDLVYQVGTTGNFLIWEFEDTNFGDDAFYTLEKDGYLIELVPLEWPTTTIETNVDGLRIGSYLYELTAVAIFGGDYDNATVTVVEELPITTSTTPTASNNGPPDFGYIPLIGVSIISVLIIFSALKRKD
jgi:hypothetical protein